MAETREIVYDDTYLQSLEALDTPEGEAPEFDPDAEYNRPAPPIEDGWYFMAFSNAGVYSDGNKVPYRSSKWKNERYPHFELSVAGEIIAPDQPLVHEKHVYSKPLTTTPDPDKKNASAVSGCYNSLTPKNTRTPLPLKPGLKHVQMLDDVLKGHPTGWARVQNILEPDKEATEAWRLTKDKAPTDYPSKIYGQKKIMALKGGTDSRGKFTGAADHPDTGTRCVARPKIVQFSDTPPAGKGA